MIVSLPQVFGIVIDISDGILGITILAWGNSIGGTSVPLVVYKRCLFLQTLLLTSPWRGRDFPEWLSERVLEVHCSVSYLTSSSSDNLTVL